MLQTFICHGWLPKDVAGWVLMYCGKGMPAERE
jgi:hypothetical protein